MKKCKLCGRELRDSYQGNVCRECRGKIGGFAKKSAAGIIAVAGTIAAGAALKSKNVSGSEGVQNIKRSGLDILDKADEFIDEHSLGARELLDRSIDAAEYRLKGLPASFARADKAGIGDKLKKFKGKLKYIDTFDDDYEEQSDQFADINRR